MRKISGDYLPLHSKYFSALLVDNQSFDVVRDTATAVFNLMQVGFEYVMETTISYIARRKLQEILRKMDEDAKRLQETREIVNQTDAHQKDQKQLRKAGNTRRWQPV